MVRLKLSDLAAVKYDVTGLKGAHTIVKLPHEFDGWGTMAINRANEPLYCLPRNGVHYIGLNRTPFDGDLDRVSASGDETDWLLGEINHIFPRLALTRQDVIYAYAGIQPVTHDPNDPKGTREVVVHDMAGEGLPNVLLLTGGPIMTYRIIAEKIVKEVSRRLSPLGEAQSPNFAASELTQQLRQGQWDKTGMNITDEALKKIVREDQPQKLADIFFRRSHLGWQPDNGICELQRVADIVAEIAGWDKST